MTDDYMPEKLDPKHPAQNEKKIAELRQLFPEAFFEGKIDFDVLRRSLGNAVDVDPKEERFGLRWPGKSKLQAIINQPSVGTLVPQFDESVDWDTTKNVIIEGDNLEVLKLLQKSYAGKVKMIYIDPPYNTGNDFVYPDDFAEGLRSYLEFTGQLGGQRRKLDSNSDTTGRYHANWLNMMYPRLFLARNLLRSDGIILVTIDDTEAANLRALMNEVFGEENFIANIVWQKKQSPQRDATLMSDTHDHILCYGIRIDSHDSETTPVIRRFAMGPEQLERYDNDDQDDRGPWTSTDLTVNKTSSERPNLFYGILNPSTGTEVYPSGRRVWSFERSKMEELLRDNRISWGESGENFPRLKVYSLENQNGLVPSTVWLRTFAGDNQASSRELTELFPEQPRIFDTPKPTRLIERMLQIGTSKEDDVVLDFFAGSGSTAHAILNQNLMDSGMRRYILVQLPESLDESITLDNGVVVETIADITRERVRRVIGKLPADPQRLPSGRVCQPDAGFRAYKLAESSFLPWNGTIPDGSVAQSLDMFAEHLHPDATDDALLSEILLRIGEELTVPVEEIELGGQRVHSISGGAAFICLERDVSLATIEAMAMQLPSEIICLDAGFVDDDRKVNAGQIIAGIARDNQTSIDFKVI
ncbi:hypothetical protein BH09CHL1_BH09CHL1_09950 [soil metagenome]